MKHIRDIIVILTVLLLRTFGAAANEIAWHNMLIDKQTNPVYSVFKDHHGLMWVGTNHGLYTFDGHIFRKVNITRNNYVADAHYHAMAEHGEDIYLATNNGLFIYRSGDGTLSAVSEDLPTEIRSIKIVGNTIWVGSLGGLYSWDLTRRTLKKHEKVRGAIYSLIETKDGSVLIGSYEGLFKLDPQTGNCEELKLPLRNASKHVFVNSMLEDRVHECIWIGTEGCLIKYLVKSGTLERMEELDGSSIKSLCLASNMDLMIGTDNGLFILKADGSRPQVCRHNSKQETSIANNVVWALYADDNRIWAGTEYGLSLYDDSDDLLMMRLEDITGRSDGNQIFAMLKDRKGALWIGGANGLIHWKDYPSTGAHSDWYTSDNRSLFISHNHVRDIHETARGDLWVATDGGINRYNEATNALINYKVYDREQSHNALWAYGICDDSEGKIWIGAYMGGVMSIDPDRIPNTDSNVTADIAFTKRHGLANNLVGQLKIDRSENKWLLLFRDKHVYRIEKNSNKVSRADILAMTGHYPETILIDDEKGMLWCGYDGGVVGIDSNLRKSDSVEFGDPNEVNKILAMTQIGSELWVSSYSGIWVVDIDHHTIRSIPFIKSPVTSIYYDEESRRVLMGSVDKILSLNPSVLNNSYVPSTLDIMSVTVNDSIFSTGTVLPTGNKYEVENDRNKITIELSCLNYDPNRSIIYAYRIDRNGEWIRLKEGDYRVVLTNLERGDHQIDFTIGDSTESMISLNMHVSEPWYSSPLAFVIYGLLTLLAIFGIIMAIRRKAKAKADEEDRRRTVIAVQNRMKFLSDISHELKTPLSLIVGPISKMLEDCSDPKIKKKLSQVYDNAIKLNSMVHKTIEINRFDHDNEALMILSRINAVEFCKNVFDTYKENHPSRHFVFTASAGVIITDIDAVKMESVLNNLFSNACKYSGQTSTISCSVSYEDGSLIIIVSDDGVGIPQDEQSLIFHRLFRSSRTADVQEGTGIGLYLVKQYVELHGGTIEVKSRENEGSTFIIRIPAKVYDVQAGEPEDAGAGASGRLKVLIVEDNVSISDFIKEVLSETYQCVTATNGRAGLSIASTYRPDIIITDEMMPVMSGLEMCAKLKEIPYLASTPIIMLTAKDDNTTETESVKLGINIFMSKPFSATLLEERVKQLLEQRKETMRQARRELLTEPKETQIDSQPEKLLALITEKIEKNISDPKLNVTYLCELTGISQQQIYRMTKKLVGLTPVEYIRQIRLRQAAMLLKQNKFTVSEVMYMVGFSSASYFSKCFQGVYGMKPSQYITDGEEE